MTLFLDLLGVRLTLKVSLLQYIVADEDEHIPVGYRMNAEAKGGLEHAFHESNEASALSYEEDSASVWNDFVARKTQASKL